MTIREYKLISSVNIKEFENEINKYIDQTKATGYFTLYGDVVVSSTPEGVRYTQALIREI